MCFSLLLKVTVPLNGVLFQTVDLLFAYQSVENQSLILKLHAQLTVAEAIIFVGMFLKATISNKLIKLFCFFFKSLVCTVLCIYYSIGNVWEMLILHAVVNNGLSG